MGKHSEEPAFNKIDGALVLVIAFTVSGVIFFGCYALAVLVTS